MPSADLCGRSSEMPLADPAARAQKLHHRSLPEGFRFFSQDVLPYGFVQRQVGHNPFPSAVLSRAPVQNSGWLLLPYDSQPHSV